MARAHSAIPAVTALGVGAAGIAVVTWGSSLATFHLGRAFAFLLPILVYLFLIASSRDPLRFATTTVAILLPVLGVTVPPARWEIAAFDVVSVLLACVLAVQVLRDPRAVDFAPTWVVWVPLLLWLPSVVLALDSGIAWREWVRLLQYYLVFVALYHCARQSQWRPRLYFALALGLLLASLFVVLQKLTGVDFMLYQTRGASALGDVVIQRGSGLFQDPQKAGQFIGVWLAVVTVLRVRGAYATAGARIVATLALLVAIPALLFTVSRLAIASGALAALIGAVALNRAGVALRVATGAVALLAASLLAFVVLVQPATVQRVLPLELVKRFEATSESADVRWEIWRDSWTIFVEHPVAGIGPGNYQEYWMRADPRLRRAKEQGLFVQDQPESGYLKLLYEGGVLGALGALIFCGGLIGAGVARLRGSGPDRALAWAALLGMAVFLATFATLFTPSDARNALIPLLLLALLAPVRDISGGGDPRHA